MMPCFMGFFYPFSTIQLQHEDPKEELKAVINVLKFILWLVTETIIAIGRIGKRLIATLFNIFFKFQSVELLEM